MAPIMETRLTPLLPKMEVLGKVGVAVGVVDDAGSPILSEPYGLKLSKMEEANRKLFYFDQ
jgi:hypothetical protein